MALPKLVDAYCAKQGSLGEGIFSMSVWNIIMVLDKRIWNLLLFPLLIICASVLSGFI
jgi:hypothetical protein